jgi:hypothetical protein
MDPRIAAVQQGITDRAGRWATLQVGYHGRSVSEVAHDLGRDWHTIMDAVIAYGEPLVDDPERIGDTDAVGLDETLFCKTGRYRTQNWSTSIVDVRNKVLLDVVAGRGGIEPCGWLDARPPSWCEQIRWATLDMSGPFKAVFDTMLTDAEQIADPFHFVKLANDKLDLVRRPTQLGPTPNHHTPLKAEEPSDLRSRPTLNPGSADDESQGTHQNHQSGKQLPEPLSPSYRNRVPKLSSTYRSHSVNYEPGLHTISPHALPNHRGKWW